MVFEKLEERIIIKGTLTLKTPLHIGSPRTEIDLTVVELPILRDTQGQPYIPGSSLKGKIRTEAERIARTEGFPLVCKPPDFRQMCGSLKNSLSELCICCRIFGTAGNNISVASKIRFRDAYSREKIEQTLVRAGIAMDRTTGSVAKEARALFEIEAIPAGASFGFEVITENLSADEKKLFKAALSSLNDSALGGSSSRGMGKIDLKLESATFRTAKYYLGLEKEQRFEGNEFQNWWAKI